MQPKRRLLICLLVLTTHVAANLCFAEDLTLRVQGTNPRFRSQAPVPLDLTLNWNSSKLIEGKLTVEIKSDLSTLVRYENPDIALAFGDLNLRILVPPLTTETEMLDIKASFYSPEWGSFDLGTSPLKVPASWKRQMMIGLVTPEGEDTARKVFDYLDRISLDRFKPPAAEDEIGEQPKNEMVVANVRFAASKAPRRVAPLCAYDVVVLGADSLSELKSRQRTSLRDWVDAGGSLLVDVSGLSTEEDCAFLNEITDRTLGENAFILDGNNNLQVGQDVLMVHHGLGRVVVTTKSPAKFSDTEATDVTCWLWKVRKSAQDSIVENGAWGRIARRRRKTVHFNMESDPALKELDPEDLSRVGLVVPAYAPVPVLGAASMPYSLLPDTVETVPLPLVILVLSLFLLVIAPGDWYLLGWMKKRMLTWFFFPAACVFFTLLMVFLANRYIGIEDYRTPIRFVDWGAADRISKITDVTMLFTSTSEPVKTRLTDQLFGPVDTVASKDWVMQTDANGSPTYSDNMTLDLERSLPPPTLTGRPTTLYDVELDLNKWTPYVIRTTGFAVEQTEELKASWLDLTPAQVFGNRNQTLKRLREANPEAEVILLSGSFRSKPVVSNKHIDKFRDTIIQATQRKSQNFFSVIARLAPNGDSALEDLALSDNTNDDEATVLIIFGKPEAIVVHRRLFLREPGGTE